MVRRSDKEASLEVRPAVGGIQTKYPSPICIETQSPDALNVLYHRRTTLRRDGCVPVNRYLAPRNSLRNRGRSLLAVRTGSAPGVNQNYKVVPGYGFIGHRDHFNDYDDGTNTTLTVSFLTTPEPTGDDPNEQANWFNFNENAGVNNTYSYRPILSKGPLRASRHALGERTAWSIFVYNAGAGDVRWGAYVQSNIAASPLLLISSAGARTNPKPFHTYRITLSITATGNHPAGTGQAILSVTELLGDGTVVRNSYTQALTGRIPMNSCPIQVFDMPRAQIEAPVLNGGLATAAGYWRTALRYEGRIQDISYWSVDKTTNGADFAFAETMTPLDTSVTQAGLLGHWAPETHTYYNRGPASWKEDQTLIPESRGLDAPIMLGPNVPVWQRINGKTGLYFDGRTSYAFMPTSVNAAASPLTVATPPHINQITVVDGSKFVDKVGATIVIGVGTGTAESRTIVSVTGNVIAVTPNTVGAHAIGDYAAVYGSDRNPSYNSAGSANLNSFESMVLGIPAGGESIHTIQVTFIPDSFEYRNDDGGTEVPAQTIFHWGGVVSFGITSRGRPYMLPWGNAGFPAFVAATHAAANTLIPGQRYTFLYARNTDIAAELYVNGRLQLSVVTTAPQIYKLDAGLPSFILGVSENGRNTILEDIGETEPETHFVGRIEDVRVGNQRVIGTFNPDPFLSLSRDLVESDLYINAQQLVEINDTNAALVSRRAFEDAAAHLFVDVQGLGTTFTKSPFFASFVKRVLVTNGSNDTTYTLPSTPPSPPIGFDDLRDRKARFSCFLGWWNFDENTLESKLESRYRDNRETTATAAAYQFYQQDLAVPDKLGFSFPLTLRSREPDVEMIAAALAAVFTWKDATPWELIPRLAAGLVPALPETNPITLIAQLKTNARNAVFAAAANTIYWLKPPWEKGDSPYPLDADPNPYSLFASGRMRNHISIGPNSTWDLSNADLTIEFWMKVPELGVRREIALNWSGTTVNNYNWRVMLTEYGALQVDGVAGAGYWRIGTVASLVAGDFHTPIVPGRWHHIAITIDVSAIANDRIWIDGTAQPMGTALGAHAAGWVGGQGFKWIAGHAIGLGSPDITNNSFAEPFFGYLRDFRVSTGLRYTTNFVRPRTPLAADGTTVSLLPLNDGEDLSASASGSTVARGTIRMEEMLPILDGSPLCSNSSERFPYSWTQYLDVVYLTNGLGVPLAIRGRAFAGPRPRSQPPAGGSPRPFGFSVARYGVSQPGFDIPRLIGQVPVTVSPVFAENAPLTVAVTFLSEDGIESNPQVYDLVVPRMDVTGPDVIGWTRLILDGIPRSLEPHVVARRIYTGATSPTLVEPEERMADNISDETELLAIAGIGETVEVNKAAPPPARFVTIFRGQSYLLNQPLLAPLELYVSEPLNAAVGTTVENFNFPSGIFRLEEGGTGHGTTGTFLAEHLGSLFCGKRDSIFQIGVSNLLNNYSLQRVATSKGFAGGHSVAAFDNHLFGAMEKGVHVFDAAGINYIGEDLEGIWNTLDLSETAMLLMRGVYHEPTNQYWLTIRRQGEAFGREILVFDKVTQDPATGRHPWSLLSTVRHSYLGKVEDEVDDAQLLYLGTPDGQVMEFLVGQVDGSRQPDDPATGLPFTLSGTVGTSTTLTGNTIVGATTFNVVSTTGMVVGGSASIGVGTATVETLTVLAITAPTQFTTTAGAANAHSIGNTVNVGGTTTTFGNAAVSFDTLGHGLRGLWVLITHANGVVEEARILSNTGVVLTFQDALVAAAAYGDTFEIGAYWAYQSTPWLPLTSMSQMKIARWLDFDFTPEDGNLLVQIVVGGGNIVLNDPFPWAVVPAGTTNEQQTSLPMTRGYHDMPCHWKDERGFYFRMAFGTRGIDKPFEVFGWNVAFDEDGLRKGRQQ